MIEFNQPIPVPTEVVTDPATQFALEARDRLREAADPSLPPEQAETLLKRANQAFSQFYAHSCDYVQAIVHKNSGDKPEVVDELVQTVYIRAFKYLHGFNAQNDKGQPVKVTTWLTRITYNEVARYHKDQARAGIMNVLGREADVAEALDLEATGLDTEETADLRASRQRAQHLLSLIPSVKLRTVVELYDVNGLSFKEISQALKIKESAARVRAHKGRKIIRESFYKLAEKYPPELY